MTKKRKTIILTLIFALALGAGIFNYPSYFNKGIEYFNNFQFSIFNFQLKLPHFLERPFRLGLDLQGGSHLVYEADLSSLEKEDYLPAMQGLRDVIERRINLFGAQEPVVQIQESAGSHRLIVELAGIKDVKEAIKMIGETPFLEFREVRGEEEVKEILNQLGIEKEEDIPLYLYGEIYFKPAPLTGKYLKSAQLGFDSTTSRPLVFLQFNEEGAKIFEELTTGNIGKPLAIFIDGLPISVPLVNETISGGKAQITGDFNVETARELAGNLNAGALPVPITLISQQTVGPILGRLSLEKSLKAGIIGLLAVILFMTLLYRLPGFLASLALLVYIIFVLAIFKLIPVTLTLAGIAGFILSIGMTVDANVLMFSRMRDELKQGKSYSVSLEEGFSRAWPSIRDGNFTTILVGLILFSFGTSFVKGFALTLIIGNLIGMFSAIFVTRELLELFIGTKLERRKFLW